MRHVRPGRPATGNEPGRGHALVPPRRRGTDARERAPRVAGMDVLLVEDEPSIRELLAEDMADAGLDVAEAPSAEVALETVNAAGEAGRSPCVLVTDVNLGGGMDGLALAREVRRRWPEVGVVYVTGRPSKLDGHALGARERFLPKPFGRSRLTAAVHQLMGRSHRRGGADKGAPPSA